MLTNHAAPVITIDGPGGCGKGTIAQRLAVHLHWHWLDSGALYRIVAWAVLHYQIPPTHDGELVNLLNRLHITFTADCKGSEAQMICDGHEVSQAVRTEMCAKIASEISSKPFVREALLQRQRDLCQSPGLVADGRDMGTVVFPDAAVKFFLTATPEERARRRYNQLKKIGIIEDIDQLAKDLATRDQRDRDRPIAPLQAAGDAIVIDTTHLSVDEVFYEVLGSVEKDLNRC